MPHVFSSSRRRITAGLLACAAVLVTDAAVAEEHALERIAADARVKIAVVPDLPPFTQRDADGQPAGLSVDLCRAVVAELATALDIASIAIDFVPVTQHGRLDAVASGEADMECGTTTVTLSRRERVDFSIPFFASGASVAALAELAPTSLQDLEGKRIAVVDGTTTQNALARALTSERVSADVLTVESNEQALAAIAEDRADALASDKMILIGLMREPGAADLVTLPGLLSFEPYAVVLPRGDADFRLAVDRALIGLYADGVLDDLYDKWLTPLGAHPGLMLERMLQLQAVPE